jgi:hypothetical protein
VKSDDGNFKKHNFSNCGFTVIEILAASTITVILVGLLGNAMNTAVTAWRTKASIDKAHYDLLLCLDQIELAITGTTISTAVCDASHIQVCYDHNGLSLSFCSPSDQDSSKMLLTEFKISQLPLNYYYLMNRATQLNRVKGIFMLRSELDIHSLVDFGHILPSSKASNVRQDDEKENIDNLILVNVVNFQASLGLVNHFSENPEIDYLAETIASKEFSIDHGVVLDADGTEVALDETFETHNSKFIDLMIETIPAMFVNKYEKASSEMRLELIQRYGVRMNRIIRFN